MDKNESTPAEDRTAKLRKWGRSLLPLGYLALLWSISLWIARYALKSKIPPVAQATPGDFNALLFGASSLALIIFSVVIGAIAVIGFDRLKKDAATEIQAATRERIDKLETELRGRVSSSIGLMLGVIHATPEEQTEEERLDYLAESVKHSEQAYAALKKVESIGQYTALNNLVYYSCALGKGYKKESLLEKAEELKRFSLEKNFWEGLVTYCRAVSDLSENPEEIEKAFRLASGLLTEPLSDRQRTEATVYVASLRKKRGQKPSGSV